MTDLIGRNDVREPRDYHAVVHNLERIKQPGVYFVASA